eukprot:3543971-Amphidinium_carterae.5
MHGTKKWQSLGWQVVTHTMRANTSLEGYACNCVMYLVQWQHQNVSGCHCPWVYHPTRHDAGDESARHVTNVVSTSWTLACGVAPSAMGSHWGDGWSIIKPRALSRTPTL